MSTISLYSKRKRAREQSGQPDVYQYESIPENVANQIVMILCDAIGHHDEYLTFIIKTLAREYGEPKIMLQITSHDLCIKFLERETNIDRKLDVVELSFRVIDKLIRGLHYLEKEQFGIKIESDAAIAELNYRLREGGVGYQFENGTIIRVDSQFVHAEITKNALSLLSSEQFSGAEDEFLSAHKHYREGEHKDAISGCWSLL